MKRAVWILAFLVPALAQAKVEVRALTSIASSTEIEATQLTKKLKALGLKGTTDSTGHAQINMKASITMTNGAACNNGRSTYRIEITELDQKDTEIGTINMDGSAECSKASDAEKLAKVFDKTWGGSLVQEDCGLGHCWKQVSSLKCINFPGDKTTKEFDSCDVEINSGN